MGIFCEAMNTIWKFPLVAGQVKKIEMPLGSEILTVQAQLNEPVIWAIVNPEQVKEVRYFELFGTGSLMPELEANKERKYINTYQVDDGNYVFHLFELKDVLK